MAVGQGQAKDEKKDKPWQDKNQSWQDYSKKGWKDEDKKKGWSSPDEKKKGWSEEEKKRRRACLRMR